PCLCCCTTGRLFAAPSPPATHALPPTCCCHDVDTPADPQPPARPTAPVPEPRCPCRDHADKQAQVTIAPAVAELALLRAGLDAAPVALPVVEPSPAAVLPPEPLPS